MKFFSSAVRARVIITKQQAKSISKMYKDLSIELAKEAEALSHRENVSSVIRVKYLNDLQKQINAKLAHMGQYQNTSIKFNMFNAANAVVNNNVEFLGKIGISLDGAYSHVPGDIVRDIASGKLYEGKWSLSSAIWKNTKKAQNDINTIVAKGVADQKSIYEIAKDLSDYVNPNKRKDWQWSKVYPGTAKVVDYNAQRLARTMISHSYQRSLVRVTEHNPFVECYEWLTSNSDRVCETCIEREIEGHGVFIDGVEIPGYYYAEDLPLDHPNGMCTVDVVTPDYDEIADRLADWVNGEEDSELDEFAEDLGYEPITFKSKVSK